MTVPSQTHRDDQAGNGVTVAFTVPFRILDQTHVRVLVTTLAGVTTEKTLTTDYTVSGVGGSSHTVTFLVAPAASETITFLRDVPLTQETDYVPNDPFPAESHEAALDKLTMIAQQQQEVIERSVTLPESVDPADCDPTLPIPAAGNLIGFNATGDGLRNYSAADIATAVAYADLRYDTFTAIAAQTDFTLSADPGSLGNLDVSIDGVTQVNGTDFTYVGTTLTFAVAMVGGEKILARYGQAVPTGVTNASAVTYDPGTAPGMVDRTVQAALRDFVANVCNFGAVADYDPTGASANGTDNTAAFNDAIEYLRSSSVNIGQDQLEHGTLVIPPGFYRVGSVDLTDIRSRNLHIQGHGAVLFGCEAGKVVVDALNTRWLHLHGLTIYGDPANPPLTGLQIGRGTVTTNGNNHIESVNVMGTFERAAVHNCASETTDFHKCRFINDNTDAAAYALIQDGRVHFLPESDYLAVTIPGGTSSSFTNNAFYSCEIRNEGGGAAMFMAQANGHTFDRGCYFLSYNDAAIVMYQTSATRCIDITLHGHFESAQTDTPTVGNTGLKSVVKFTGDATASYVRGLRIHTHSPHCCNYVFDFATGAAFNVYNADMEIQSLNGGSASFFGGANVATAEFHGRLSTILGTQLNAGAIAAFNGFMQVEAFLTIASAPTAGNYITHSMDTNAMYFGGGTMRNWGHGAAAGVVWQAAGSGTNIAASVRGKGDGDARMGNEKLVDAFTVAAVLNDVNGLGVIAAATGVAPRLVAQGADTNIDLKLSPKGTGVVQYGTRTAIGAETLTGYITIKDAGGTTRKIGVVS